MLLALWVAVLAGADAAGLALGSGAVAATVGGACVGAVALLARRRWVLGGAGVAAAVGLLLGHGAAAPPDFGPALGQAVAVGDPATVEGRWVRLLIERGGADAP